MTLEVIEKVRGCETDEGRRAFLEENGIELSDEQLEGIAGEEPHLSIMYLLPSAREADELTEATSGISWAS